MLSNAGSRPLMCTWKICKRKIRNREPYVGKYLSAAFILLFACAALAQEPAAKTVPPTSASAATRAISYELDWPQANPKWVSITVAADGSASYRSQDKVGKDSQSDEPYVLNFTTTEATRKRILDLAKALNYFHGDFEYRSGSVAKTGKKTLRYLNGPDSSETSLNFSTNTAMMDLVGIFQ